MWVTSVSKVDFLILTKGMPPTFLCNGRTSILSIYFQIEFGLIHERDAKVACQMQLFDSSLQYNFSAL